ncbi:hypothetical protein BH24CHL5_BH24CHL5_12480 [soil metagenome]
MDIAVILPALTALLALVFSVALFDQWLERRRGFQLIWAIGMLFFAVASGSEAIGALLGWNEAVYRAWYLTGAVWTAAWLGLGTAYLLGRTRFGYAYAALVLLGGLIVFVARNRYPDAGSLPVLLLIAALIVALAIAVETYFQNERWPQIAALAVALASVAAAVVAVSQPLVGGSFALDPRTGIPTGEAIPCAERLLSLLLNVPGGLALGLGALFSAYIFMPKKRVLDYSLDAGQSGDEFLFNLLIAPVAIAVNFFASLPTAIVALVTGRIHSRVPATLLIGTGALVASSTDALSRLGSTDLFQVGKFVGVLLIFVGFLISVEVFREIRIPFTSRVLRGARTERAG